MACQSSRVRGCCLTVPLTRSPRVSVAKMVKAKNPYEARRRRLSVEKQEGKGREGVALRADSEHVRGKISASWRGTSSGSARRALGSCPRIAIAPLRRVRLVFEARELTSAFSKDDSEYRACTKSSRLISPWRTDLCSARAILATQRPYLASSHMTLLPALRLEEQREPFIARK